MSTTAPPLSPGRPPVATPTVVTPTVREAGRRARYWVIAVIAALVIVVIGFLVMGAGSHGGPPLSPDNAAPEGSMALAEVLRDHGVTVTETDSILATRGAAGTPDDTTIFVVDDGGYLDGDQLRELERLASRLVIMTPGFDQLEALAPEVAQAGTVSGLLEADCELGPVERAGTVTGDGTGFRIIARGADAVGCLDSGDDVHSLVVVNRGQKQVSIVGLRDAFTNGQVADNGNAALALGILGEKPNLVWLLPSIAEANAGPDIAELTPEWIGPVMVLAILTTIAAAFWRGRRLGPLVVENLPVVVRASETMEGRARLYEKSSARLRALDALRIGTIDRLGTLCGLPRSASTDEVIHAVSAAVGRSDPQAASRVAALLRDTAPATDAELVRLSDELLVLERSVASVLRPEPNQSKQAQPRTGENDNHDR
ncbi:DUF4350 domain-containing protein [Leifsonia bigeumensis]|uniref:DUF4350 domain-containing protein n=1 Tax=Leifsonella bigeumensis TaxID=433643 RepID=A0ABP7FBM0_9MICO